MRAKDELERVSNSGDHLYDKSQSTTCPCRTSGHLDGVAIDPDPRSPSFGRGRGGENHLSLRGGGEDSAKHEHLAPRR